MTTSCYIKSVPIALLCLAMATTGQAQNVLTNPAPGLNDTAPRPVIVPEQNLTPATPEAQTEQNFGSTNIDATNIIRELAPFAGGNPGAPRQVQTPNGTVTTDAARSIDLTVFFAYDSDALLPEARVQLDALGWALNDPALLPYDYLIAGHTDAQGSASYNLDLSIRRALSVARYLVTYHNINPQRLVAHGWGEAQLKLPSDPLSGANRRVEVSLILPRQSHDHAPQYVHPVAYTGWETAYFSRLSDPRWQLRSDALDDFHSAPTFIHN